MQKEVIEAKIRAAFCTTESALCKAQIEILSEREYLKSLLTLDLDETSKFGIEVRIFELNKILSAMRSHRDSVDQ